MCDMPSSDMQLPVPVVYEFLWKLLQTHDTKFLYVCLAGHACACEILTVIDFVKQLYAPAPELAARLTGTKPTKVKGVTAMVRQKFKEAEGMSKVQLSQALQYIRRVSRLKAAGPARATPAPAATASADLPPAPMAVPLPPFDPHNGSTAFKFAMECDDSAAKLPEHNNVTPPASTQAMVPVPVNGNISGGAPTEIVVLVSVDITLCSLITLHTT